ncbi:unknown [[Ruminococcus] torques CAG:61]|uniref:Uncharacterized protein n=1 Tax=[Ruminococcus] torques CAG:61 TaxID=1263108 RepID=R5QEY3_9FIRM|nr:unknown [[Ruminococcus] torques CAG:61]
MILNKFSQTFQCILMCLRLTDIKGDLMLYIFPVICYGIVHMHRIPHDIGEEAHSILMERNCLDRNLSFLFIIIPLVCRNDFSCRAVYNLPPTLNVIPCIRTEHVRIKTFHDLNRQTLGISRIKRRHKIHLLYLFRICLRPLIVFSCRIICRINFRVCVFERLRKICTVTVSDRICSPALHQFQSLGNNVEICRDGHKSF